jgi:hypothetical protein
MNARVKLRDVEIHKHFWLPHKVGHKNIVWNQEVYNSVVTIKCKCEKGNLKAISINIY